MTQDNLSYNQRLRLIKLGLLPKEVVKKSPKPLKKISDKKAKDMAEEKKDRETSGDYTLDKWFDHFMAKSQPECAECGMKADWLLEEQTDPKKKEAYRMMWKACQAHVLPKKKKYGFPSLATNLNNHIVLFPSWGGHLCGCHGFYDSNWYNASTMKIWPQIVERFKQLYPLIPEKEKKNIPEQLLKEIQ